MDTNGIRLVKISPQVQAKIRSSVDIISLNDVIIGLIQNSLDAGAQHIEVRFDYLKGYCSVLDDGTGIGKEEFLQDGHLAKLYYTSKTSSSDAYHGRYGRFLSSLINVALVSIISRTKTADRSVCSAVFRGGRRLATNINVPNDSSIGICGSKIVVHDLFGSIPVRAKYHRSVFGRPTEVQSEFLSLKKTLATLALVTSRPLVLGVQGQTHRYVHRHSGELDVSTDSGASLNYAFSLHRIVYTFFHAGLVDSLNTDDWRQVAIKTSQISARAAINLQPGPSRNNQIITINQCPISVEKFTSLFDHINSLFAASTFGVEGQRPPGSNDSDSFQPRSSFNEANEERQFLRLKKGVDRWPIFYVQVRLNNWTSLESLLSVESDRTMMLVIDSLHAMMAEFLQSYNFDSLAPLRCGKRRKQPDKTVVENVKHNASGFNSWSRIKSANSTPIDILTGLPFLFRNDNKAEKSASSSRHSVLSPDATSSQSDPQMIKWTNPQSGQELNIDSRTGMVVRSELNLTQIRLPTPLDRCSKTVTDVAQHLKDRTFESALSTISPAWHGSLHSGCLVCISGPVSAQGSSSSKNMTKASHLRGAKILGQVDRKFILASVQSNDGPDLDSDTNLILIDQHAADERIKVEDLFRHICDKTAVNLAVPITFEVNTVEAIRFQESQAYFASWNIFYIITPTNQIQVSALPEPIAERCRLEPKLLIELLRLGIWQDGRTLQMERQVRMDDWLSMIGTCPQGVLDILASRACRSAVMFNDVLSIEQCQGIVKQLGNCLFPFQCAHGRPTLVHLAKIQDIVNSRKNELDNSNFGSAWNAWTITNNP